MEPDPLPVSTGFLKGFQRCSRRHFLKTSLALSGIGFGIGLNPYGWEPHWVQFVHRSLPIKNLPPVLKGRRLVPWSDLHIGIRVEENYLLGLFERVKELTPDIVVYTGDFADFKGGSASGMQRVLRHLPLGSKATLGVLGNHDYGPGWSHPEIANKVATLAGHAGV